MFMDRITPASGRLHNKEHVWVMFTVRSLGTVMAEVVSLSSSFLVTPGTTGRPVIHQQLCLCERLVSLETQVGRGWGEGAHRSNVYSVFTEIVFGPVTMLALAS